MEEILVKVKEKPFWALFFTLSAGLIGLLVFRSVQTFNLDQPLDWEMFFWFLLVGLLAQAIDGSLGMAYGLTSNSMLLAIGIPPSLASAWVHFAQVFTSLASGLSHLKVGNINWPLAKRLIIPGVIGSVLGAYFLSSVDGNMIKPFIAVYLFVMGLVVIRKAFKMKSLTVNKSSKSLPALAATGGFADAIGGGGWGPIVNSTLLGKGHSPRYAIGTGNFVEIFVSLASASTFLFILKELSLAPVLGLIIGGVISSPFAALLCKNANPKVLMGVVGCLILLLSLRTLMVVL